ncbi:MAG: hypothetical protein R6U89_05205 [Dehalococcoidia bacterium]
MTIEVQHTITEGMEKEAFQVIRELYSKGLNYPGAAVSSSGLLTQHSVSPGLEVSDGYRDHLGKVFSQVRRVVGPQARIKVRLTA